MAPTKRRTSLSGLPRNEYLEELPGTARALIDATKSVLQRTGFERLTLDAIAREAGENKAMVKYYFGDKAGLMAAVVDSLVHDATVTLLEGVESLPPGPRRVHEHLCGCRQVMEEPEFNSLFDLLPQVLRDPKLRDKVADLYDWYRELNVRCLGTQDGQTPERVEALASLIVAVVDGLAIQVALQPGKLDLDTRFDVLEQMVKSVLEPASAAREDGSLPDGDSPAEGSGGSGAKV